MNKGILSVIVIVVVVGLGIWYWVATAPASSQTGDQTASTTEQSGVPASGSSDLRTITAQGGNYTCTIDNSTADGVVSGTIYGSGGQTRLDFSVRNNDGTTVMTHVIRSGGYSYTWVDGQTTGTKAAVTSSTPIISQPQGGVISVTDTSSFDSECHPWSPDVSEFTPPTGISFVLQ